MMYRYVFVLGRLRCDTQQAFAFLISQLMFAVAFILNRCIDGLSRTSTSELTWISSRWLSVQSGGLFPEPSRDVTGG